MHSGIIIFLLQYSCFIFFFIILVIYLFSAVLGSRCCMDSALFVASSAALAVVCGLLAGTASPVGEHRPLGLQLLWLLGSGARAQ